MKKHLSSSLVRFIKACSMPVVGPVVGPVAWPVTWIAGIVAVFLPSTEQAKAQIIPTADGAGTTATASGNQYDIAGGTQVEGNLFHEFDKFDLEADQTANFLSDSGVFNIVGQVSAANPSHIDGTVQVTNSDANLYLVNPSGILFGPNAQLSLQGSFTATSADQIEFENGVLNVLEQENDYTALSENPTALTFSKKSASAIVNQGELAIREGESLSLVGGSVVNTGSLEAPNGEIGLVAVGGNSTVNLAVPGSLLSIEVETANLDPSLGNNGVFVATDLPKLLTGTGAEQEANSLTVNANGSVSLGGVALEEDAAAIAGEISVASANAAGGSVVAVGESVSVVGATIDASGTRGGTVRIGGDIGGEGTLPTADATFVDSASVIQAEGETTAGGNIVVWANETATVAGTLSAQGETEGGFIETSADYLDISEATVKAGGETAAGTWLVDPVDIEIVGGIAGVNQISDTTIEDTIDSNTNFEVTTSGAGSGNGDIKLSTDIIPTGFGTGSLTLTSRRFENSGRHRINLAGGGDLTFNLNAVNAESNPDGSSIATAIASIGFVPGSRTINLSAGDYELTEAIDVTTDVAIQGAGAENTHVTTVLAGIKGISVASEVSAALRDVTVTTSGLGANDLGGGVTNRGTLLVENSHFIDNRASQNGGAIDSFSGGALTVVDSLFRNNRTGENGSGGAIYIGETTGLNRIDNSSFEDNYAAINGGALSVDGSDLRIENGTQFLANVADNNGGALNLSGNGTADLTTLVVRKNAAQGMGGAINLQGDSAVTINSVNLSDNQAITDGGAIANTSNSGQLTLTNSTLDNNTANDNGGAIFSTADSVLALTAVGIDDNTAGGDGGAIYIGGNSGLTTRQVGIRNNRAGEQGGGLYYASTRSADVSATFRNNAAVSNGGAIANNDSTAELVIQNSTFVENSSQADGGALFATRGASTTVNNTRFIDNRAEGAASQGGGLAITTGATVSITDTEVSGNTSTWGGAGLFLSGSSTATVIGELAIDTDGRANSATTQFANNTAGRDGGGIAALVNSQLTISGVLFENNASGDDGGGVAVTELSHATIDNANFENNTTAENGGGLYGNNITSTLPVNDKIILTNSRFIGNQANISGGGFHQGINSAATVSNTVFRENEAVTDGGGVHVSEGRLALENSQLIENRARHGAGLEVSSGGTATVSDTTFSTNISSFIGGGAQADLGTTLKLNSSTFEGNTAESGGGLFNIGETEIVNSTFSGNLSNNDGGAIHSYGANASLDIRSSTITANSATAIGGGILDKGSRSIRLQNTIVADNNSLVSADVSGDFTDAGNNLIGSDEGATGFTNSTLVGGRSNRIDPQLQPLADNGGPTKTHLLSSNSLAINAGSNLNLPSVDQRGLSRITGNAADIGAVELSASETPEVIPAATQLDLNDFLTPTLTTTEFSELDALLAHRIDHTPEDSEATIRRLEQSYSRGFEDYWDLSTEADPTFSEVQAILRRAQEEYTVNSAVVYATFTPETSSEEEQTDTILQVEPTLGEDDLLNLSVVLPEGELVSYELPVTRKEVSRQVRYFRSTVSDLDDARGYRPLAQQLYQWLLAPLEKDLASQNIQNLMYALDDGLRTAPITAMRDSNGFSLERYGISIVPSMGLMQADFPVPVRRSTVAMGVSEFENDTPLPAVPIELEVIDQFVPVSQTALNEETTIAALKGVQSLDQPGVLHLATHAVFNRSSPDESYIHLWNEPLSMREFSTLDWEKSDLELLILSACYTALGSRNAELGFAGLAAASGVDATVGSLWDVSDVGTLALMSEFYAQLETNDLRFEALRKAQLALLNGETRIENGDLVNSHGVVELPDEWDLPDTATLDHPFFWSAFTMVGNPW